MPETNTKSKINWSLTGLLLSVFINLLLGGTVIATQRQAVEIASLDKRTTVLEYQYSAIQKGIEEMKDLLKDHMREER
jgi:hypothetical protein